MFMKISTLPLILLKNLFYVEKRGSSIFPLLCRRLWISEERRWQEELSSLGDLCDQWHTRQMALLNQHVTLINIYTMALDVLHLAANSGKGRCYVLYHQIQELSDISVHLPFCFSYLYTVCAWSYHSTACVQNKMMSPADSFTLTATLT